MRTRLISASAVAVTAALTALGSGTAVAHASTPVTASATTSITGLPDSGYGGNNWASDTISRTATVTLIGPVNDGCTTAATCYEYRGTIKDTGVATGIAGQTSPGAQGVPIKGSPKATITGSATVTFFASSDTPDAKSVPAKVSGKSLTAKDGGYDETTTQWVTQFFPLGTNFGSAGPDLPTWTWTYVDAADCQTWVDTDFGNAATSGDITGTGECPVISGGKATATANGATVSWTTSKPSDFVLTLTGPGQENGRTATVTKPAAVYSGLESGHTYEVHIQPLYDGKAGGKAGVISFKTTK